MLVWYVIQVINGREDIMRERIERVVPAGAMQELFYPQYQTEIKVHGEWVNTTKPLFPGYLICDTADPRTLQQYLLRMDDFARVLSQDGQFVPLAKEEVQLIGGFTHRGDRVVPMSEALKDGDQVVVTAGPLLGHEGLIKTINRRKSTAYLELDLCGRRVTTRVGLACFQVSSASCATLKRRSPKCGRSPHRTGRILGGGDVVLEENVSDKTEYATDAPAGAALIAQAMDRREGAGRYKAMQSIMDWDRSRLTYRAVKRAFDIVFSGCVLAVIAVPSLVLAALIRLESEGNPFYSQIRVGRTRSDGSLTTFRMWKFRSMYRDADQRLAELKEQNEIAGAMFKMKNDPRVTKIGKFIRKHSIDEFPLFLNVFLGQMSVVGPRPPLPNEVAEYTEYDLQRLAVKPGITGWWQVTERNSTGFDGMVRRDLEYIAKRGALFDLKIILLTVIEVVSGNGAF